MLKKRGIKALIITLLVALSASCFSLMFANLVSVFSSTGNAESPSAAALTITSLSGLKSFANNVSNGTNSYEGKTVELGADINCLGENFGIGNFRYPFKGSFNGKGHTIHNLNIVGEAGTWLNRSESLGLFGAIEPKGADSYISNLRVKDVTISAANSCDYAGGLIGHVTVGGDIKDIYIESCIVENVTIDCRGQSANELASVSGVIANSMHYGAGTIHMNNVLVKGFKAEGVAECYSLYPTWASIVSEGLDWTGIKCELNNCISNCEAGIKAYRSFADRYGDNEYFSASNDESFTNVFEHTNSTTSTTYSSANRNDTTETNPFLNISLTGESGYSDYWWEDLGLWFFHDGCAQGPYLRMFIEWSNVEVCAGEGGEIAYSRSSAYSFESDTIMVADYCMTNNECVKINGEELKVGRSSLWPIPNAGCEFERWEKNSETLYTAKFKQNNITLTFKALAGTDKTTDQTFTVAPNTPVTTTRSTDGSKLTYTFNGTSIVYTLIDAGNYFTTLSSTVTCSSSQTFTPAIAAKKFGVEFK